ncbi:heme/hemin ABC transporter substrate-binding protein [Ningiella sp. W23]|uniref:heme/hemin ABC transporter substrate-binding protein n=1 Tax=Ningiella sp. W23 TaxID=3023715 RepID=UPI0037568461
MYSRLMNFITFSVAFALQCITTMANSAFANDTPILVNAFNSNDNVRIISAGGSMTELLFAMGMQNSIVAVDTSSSFPKEVQDLPKVGYYRQLGTEGLLSLKPTHLFAAKGVGPRAVVDQLRAMGVEVAIFEQNRSVEGLTHLISELGHYLNKTKEAEALVNKLARDIAALPQLEANIRLAFLMSVNERGITAAGSNTVPNLLLELLGLENPFISLDGFKPVSSEALIASATQQVFMPAHQTRGLSPQELCELPALANWAQLQGCNVHIVDSLLYLGLTPRLADAASDMATKAQLPLSRTHNASSSLSVATTAQP